MSEAADCPRCQGTGLAHVPAGTTVRQTRETRDLHSVCKACNGTGEVSDNQKDDDDDD